VSTIGRRGFTLVELVIVFGIVAALAVLGFPRMQQAWVKSQVRSARGSVVSVYYQARARAIREGRNVTVHFDPASASVWATASPRRAAGPASCGCDTVGPVRNLGGTYGVAVGATPDTFRVDPRGLGVQPAATGTAVVLTRGQFRDSVLIYGYGRIGK
jgi:prepilin-type N-terminal cleavage/methylation domain-containing protein